MLELFEIWTVVFIFQKIFFEKQGKTELFYGSYFYRAEHKQYVLYIWEAISRKCIESPCANICKNTHSGNAFIQVRNTLQLTVLIILE